MKKKPRFFCDHCGNEVSGDVKSCSNCGRYFSAVRCPSCNYSGPDEMFKAGCPMCGYSAPPPPKSKPVRPKKTAFSWNKQDHAQMPAWTYIVSIIVVLAIIAVISFFITR